MSEWNSLEVAKLGASIFTPVVVIVLGLFINRRLKRFEHLQWSNQKLIEKRLELYDKLAPQLNKLYCFYMWVGYWKKISPEEAIATKRELDMQVNIYRHLLGTEFYSEYEKYIALLFETYW